MTSERCRPMKRPKRPAMMDPRRGNATISVYIFDRSALHQIDVLNRDGAAVAEVDDEDGEADRGFGGGDRQHEEREDLTGQVAQESRERDEVDVDREEDELDRHQDDDDVLAVDEDAEDADGEEQRGNDEI